MSQLTSDLSVGEVAERSGVPISTLHFYERKGLLASRRTAGNQRRYPRAVLRRVAVVRVAQRAGIPLADIRAALDALPLDQAPTAKDWARFVVGWRDVLQSRIASLTQLRDQMTACIGCGCMSLRDCPLRNPEDALRADGPGARLLVPNAPNASDVPGASASAGDRAPGGAAPALGPPARAPAAPGR